MVESKKRFFPSYEWIYKKKNKKKSLNEVAFLKQVEFQIPLKTKKFEMQEIFKKVYNLPYLKINTLIQRGDRKKVLKNSFLQNRKSYKKARIYLNEFKK